MLYVGIFFFFFFNFWPIHPACQQTQCPRPGVKPGLQQWKCRVLTTDRLWAPNYISIEKKRCGRLPYCSRLFTVPYIHSFWCVALWLFRDFVLRGDLFAIFKIYSVHCFRLVIIMKANLTRAYSVEEVLIWLIFLQGI